MQVELRQGQTISDWIPVECAHPEDGREVLVTVQEDLGFDSISNAFPRVVTSVTTAVYEAGTDTFKWFNGHGNLSAYTRVIAWSELPGGYRG